MLSLIAIYAAIATAWAIWSTFNVRRWRRSYHRALALFGTLPQPGGKTPHQKAATTRAAKRLADMRAHRLAFEASMKAERG
jgi:hypothetical protein